MITQKQAYKMAVDLRDQGMSLRDISLTLARSGWISKKTGRALRPESVSTLLTRMRRPDYQISNMKVIQHAAGAKRYQGKTTKVIEKVADTFRSQPSGIDAIALAEKPTRFSHALNYLEEISRKQRQFADALDILIAAVK